MNAQRKFIRKRILAASVSAIIAASCIGVASAKDTGPKYTLNTITDAAHGRKIIAGEYDEAINKIKTSSRWSTDNYYAATNLCVAYIMTRDIESGTAACDAAVMQMEEKLASRRSFQYPHSLEGRAYRRYLAIALSNRGVLRAIGGEAEQAREDFRNAMELQARIPAAEVNLARLENRVAPNA